MNKIICPVPESQRPLNEFNNIRNSWLISWPFLERNIFYRKLTVCWLFITPVSLTISYGSNHLKNNIFELLFVSLTVSLAFPILLLIRQWLSWTYIYKRLNSEKIEYEESGWYDGQIWEKPINWRAKDLLIAQNQIKPILNHLEVIIILLVSVVIVSLLFIFLGMN
ncbi:CGLD27 family protein [Prochlorococcus marinus]|uniref:CGLD27 family protein n=1 Tax=Prochlorococcus marinus TaxID=1219 RepID=UPI0022B4D984|nr:CGLD27 family protein [Prochlorococcus marinus]